jgi:phosphomevalonate kinase
MKAEGIGWGKLYVVGEYAVIYPGYPAVILATQRNIRATIEASNRFHLKNENSQIIFDDLNASDEFWKYAIAAISVFYEFLMENDYPVLPVSITLESDLESEDGRKLGLGSSGAVVAAIIKGLSKYYNQPLDAISIFKLCVISQKRLNVSGSFGDLAAAVFGGIIRYTRFADFDMSGSITQLIESDWPQSSIAYLSFPFELNLVVGWTGEPASTQHRVDWLSKFNDDQAYNHLVSQSEKIVDDLIQSRLVTDFMDCIHRYREWLKRLEEFTHLIIETPRIETFIDICIGYGGAAKSSGAGGGDCAIAFFAHPMNISDILLDKGIVPLTITIAKREVV